MLGGTALALWQDAHWLLPIMPGVASTMACVFAALALSRFWQGLKILRYRANLRKLPRYVLDADAIPVSKAKLFLGRGFRWDQRHSQRLIETLDPAKRRWLDPGPLYRAARALELTAEHRPWLEPLARFTRRDSPWNPVRPLPPVGGNACLHGVGLEDERDVWMDLGDRVAHTLVLGTTRVGKTRLAELLVAQDIRRGETVIVFDPKGDLDLLGRMFAECLRTGRLEQFHVFHLGYPDFSERYNPVGEFGRITEVASRIATQLPSEGNSAAFREFAWRFTNIVSRALVGLGRKPAYADIARYVTHIEPLLIEYHELWFKADARARLLGRQQGLQLGVPIAQCLRVGLWQRQVERAGIHDDHVERGIELRLHPEAAHIGVETGRARSPQQQALERQPLREQLHRDVEEGREVTIHRDAAQGLREVAVVKHRAIFRACHLVAFVGQRERELPVLLAQHHQFAQGAATGEREGQHAIDGDVEPLAEFQPDAGIVTQPTGDVADDLDFLLWQHFAAWIGEFGRLDAALGKTVRDRHSTIRRHRTHQRDAVDAARELTVHAGIGLLSDVRI